MIERVLVEPPELAATLAQAAAAEHRIECVAAAPAAVAQREVVDVELARWADPAWDPGPFDWGLGDRAWTHPLALRVRAAGVAAADAPALFERLLTRVQRFVDRRNDASRSAVFDRVLRRHRALHDRRFPLVRADHDHAVDTWRWTLRLAPDASLALQVAALFHDVERLVTEAHARREHLAKDHLAYKEAHARAGAAIARRALASAGLDPETTARVEALVAQHERPLDEDEERRLLTDADALSFFSLNASGFLAYYGPTHTRAKVTYTLSRLRPQHHARLGRLHLRHDVLALVSEQRPELRRAA